MMLKNFGVTRQRRVVFYDYDEIQYMTDCKFRKIPPPSSWEDGMQAEPHYSIEENDVFPEQFRQFFFSEEGHRLEFFSKHGDLIDPKFWIDKRDQLSRGIQDEVLPYPKTIRFMHRFQ